MSGPVWRVYEGDEMTCNECLRETTHTMVEGEIHDGEHRPQRYLCEDCYPNQVSVMTRAKQ
jgi:transposase-like protein